MRWVGHVTSTEEKCIQSFGRNIQGERSLENPVVDWEIILKRILKKLYRRVLTGLT
jgi:hypothetical protein